MITEDFVSFEVAKLLKEKGFDKFSYYGWDEQLFDKEHPRNFSIGIDDKKQWISCHTHQMAMKWLREVHNLHIWFGHSVGKGLSWYYEIHGISDGKVKHIGGIQYGSYEVACESALKYALENLL